MSTCHIYRTEVDWSALVELDSGRKVTLTFVEEPTEAEAIALAEQLMVEPETAFEIEAENGQIIL